VGEKEEFLIQMRTDVTTLQLALAYASYIVNGFLRRFIENYQNDCGTGSNAKHALWLHPCLVRTKILFCYLKEEQAFEILISILTYFLRAPVPVAVRSKA
jgi:hypothetical protein